MIKTWCLGGRHYSNSNNITQYEKVNPRTQKLVKTRQKMTLGESRSRESPWTLRYPGS